MPKNIPGVVHRRKRRQDVSAGLPGPQYQYPKPVAPPNPLPQPNQAGPGAPFTPNQGPMGNYPSPGMPNQGPMGNPSQAGLANQPPTYQPGMPNQGPMGNPSQAGLANQSPTYQPGMPNQGPMGNQAPPPTARPQSSPLPPPPPITPPGGVQRPQSPTNPGQRPPEAMVIIEVDGQVIKTAILNKPSLTIGRLDSSDIQIPNQRVSRLHAKIVAENGAWVVEDAGSVNGVVHQGQRIQRAPLNHGDRVYVAPNIVIQYEIVK